MIADRKHDATPCFIGLSRPLSFHSFEDFIFRELAGDLFIGVIAHAISPQNSYRRARGRGHTVASRAVSLCCGVSVA